MLAHAGEASPPGTRLLYPAIETPAIPARCRLNRAAEYSSGAAPDIAGAAPPRTVAHGRQANTDLLKVARTIAE
jgi:hypothetical protein